MQAFDIEQPSKGASGLSSWAESSNRPIEDDAKFIRTAAGGVFVNIRGCVIFWSAVLATIILLAIFYFYERRDTSSLSFEKEFFREDHGFDMAAVSIADKLGYTLKICKGGEYCVSHIGLYARVYPIEDAALDLRVTVSQECTPGGHEGCPLAVRLVCLNLPRTRMLNRAVGAEIFRNKDEGYFSGLVFERLSGGFELSAYGSTRERPTPTQALGVVADLVVAVHALHNKVKDYAILHCFLSPSNVFIKETEPYWQATLTNYHQSLVQKLSPGDKITEPIFTQFSEFKNCRGTDWDHWAEGVQPYSANVEWRSLGILLFRLLEVGEGDCLYDLHKILFTHYNPKDCNYECSLRKALSNTKRLTGDLLYFVRWLILKHDTIEDEEEVLGHPIFDSMPLNRDPLDIAGKIDMFEPSKQFVNYVATFKNLMSSELYRHVSSEEATEFPLVAPGFPYYIMSSTFLTLEIFLDFTSPWCKRLYETIAHQVAPAYKSTVNFIFQSAPEAHHPQSSYIHEVALAVNDMAGPRMFWEFADVTFMRQKEFLDAKVYDISRDALHDKLLRMVGSVGVDNLSDLRRRLRGKYKWKVKQEMKFARKYVVENGYCVWTPLVALNGDWVSQAGSLWRQEDWRNFLDFHIALVEDPQNAGAELQARKPYDNYDGGGDARSQQPLKPIGVSWPGKPARIKLELFLDFADEDSKKVYNLVNSELASMYDGKVTFTFQNVIGRGAHASVYMHEVALAVLLDAGPVKFFDFAARLFKNQHMFEDDVLANRSRHQIYQELASKTGEEMFEVFEHLEIDGKGNSGNRVTDHIKFADRYACSHGVYEGPRAFLNGITVDGDLANWELENWKSMLDKATEALEVANHG